MKDHEKEVHEKIRFIRQFEGLSQEKMAEKLGMTLNGYANIELGKTDPLLSRLKQISETLGVELGQLVGLNKKNVFNFIENFNDLHNNFIFQQSHHNTTDQTTCKHELEKANLINEQKDKEIAYLKELNEQKDKEIAYLKEMIELMKKQA